MPETCSPTPASVVTARTPGAVVAGYRLLRPVAGAGGAEAWLARAPGTDQTVCVEVGPPTEALERRVTAHSRVRSPYVLALLDLATDADGRVVLVCERTDWTLATLLASRARLAPGEGVTVLAPLAAGLAAIHRAGLLHGSLAAATVLFCPDGRPVIGGLESGRANLAPDTRGGRTDPGLIADYRALRNLVAAVASVIDEPARSSFSAVAGWIDEQLARERSDSFLGQLECRLFALAPALPVVLVADRRRATAAPDAPSAHRPTRAAVAARRVARGLPGRAATALARSGLAGWFSRVLRGRALAVCLGTALLVTTLLAGLALIPERSADPTLGGLPAARPAGPRQTAVSGTPAEGQAEAAALGGEDAVAATKSLLRVRASCMTEDSIACVPGYAEPRSALSDADSHSISGAGRDGALLLDDESRSGVELVQVFGDAALLRVLPADEKRQPVLVLAVRTDTGWRLRDLFEPD